MSAILLAVYLAPAWVPSEWNYRWSLPSDPLWRASAVPSVEGPGRHVERASQREKLEVIEAQKAEAKAEAVREASRKNSVHMRAEAEASGDGEGTPLGNLEV